MDVPRNDPFFVGLVQLRLDGVGSQRGGENELILIGKYLMYSACQESSSVHCPWSPCLYCTVDYPFLRTRTHREVAGTEVGGTTVPTYLTVDRI